MLLMSFEHKTCTIKSLMDKAGKTLISYFFKLEKNGKKEKYNNNKKERKYHTITILFCSYFLYKYYHFLNHSYKSQ